MCRSTNRRPPVAQPQVYFRIVHATLKCVNGCDVRARAGPMEATLCDQTVEIALGPKGVFENGNIGALKRRVTAGQVVKAAPSPRGSPKPPREPRTPRVKELLQKASEWRDLLESGKVATKAEIARREGITRARVTQVMGLLRLAPEIQRHILAMPDSLHCPTVTERAIRHLVKIENIGRQISEFAGLLD